MEAAAGPQKISALSNRVRTSLNLRRWNRRYFIAGECLGRHTDTVYRIVRSSCDIFRGLFAHRFFGSNKDIRGNSHLQAPLYISVDYCTLTHSRPLPIPSPVLRAIVQSPNSYPVPFFFGGRIRKIHGWVGASGFATPCKNLIDSEGEGEGKKGNPSLIHCPYFLALTGRLINLSTKDITKYVCLLLTAVTFQSLYSAYYNYLFRF